MLYEVITQNALARNDDPNKASRPFDKNRNGIVVAEGGALYVLERLEDAQKRGANIIAEIVGWGINTDATDFVLPVITSYSIHYTKLYDSR